ncbi:MAG: MOSC domain-containing protein [Chitinophagaceae bacterium]|nr:MOSC domain-containing protein [Chitinophagaceae bacterium]
MYTVSQLYIYPIKSLGGIAVNEAKITDRGLEFDRRWMLVDNNYQFLTQRKNATMALLSMELHHDHFIVRHKMIEETLKIPFITSNPKTAIATIWDDECLVRFVSNEADEWFSTMLSMQCRLVYMPNQSKRQIEEPFGNDQNITSLSDGYPVLIIGQSSLDELNNRLAEPITIDRFRPNIVFTGGNPHAEDDFTNFTINDASFRGVKASSRCNVITIDQQTGIATAEPLTTLATYRKQHNKVYFGQNLLIGTKGTIAAGQRIEM